MEDVGAVAVHEQAGVVMVVVRVAADVIPLLDDEYSPVQLGRQPLGQHAPGEPRPDDPIIGD